MPQASSPKGRLDGIGANARVLSRLDIGDGVETSQPPSLLIAAHV